MRKAESAESWPSCKDEPTHPMTSPARTAGHRERPVWPAEETLRIAAAPRAEASRTLQTLRATPTQQRAIRQRAAQRCWLLATQPDHRQIASCIAHGSRGHA
ncbi:hypothetical protein CBM2615_A280354 [Cupriavidus taiwanensis]|nr:hypothetical protein CBM2615_A280354 [Cupriavidus taiwanensis]